jgi:chromate transporter
MSCLDNRPSLATLCISFLKLGVTAFGGPAMVAYIKEMAVNRYKWLDEERFRDGIALCQTIPGATAMQMAAYVGLRARGITGALVSLVGFGLPAFILMLILSSLYAKYHAVPKVGSLFQGLQVIVVAIVANATYSFGKNTFKNYRDGLFAIVAGILFWSGVSPFVVIIGTACVGAVLLKKSRAATLAVQEEDKDLGFFKQLIVLFSVLLGGLLVLYFIDARLLNLAVLMMRIDLFAFGGGFASIPLMLHEIVNVRGWMDGKTFMDGIALGQVTPGPIVITSTFVGYMSYGLWGAIVATTAIFTPSFLMVIFVTPVYDRLKASAYFTGATKGILASFVGLLFFVTVKFALDVPWDIFRVVLIGAAFAALVKKVDVFYVVLASATVSLFLF